MYINGILDSCLAYFFCAWMSKHLFLPASERIFLGMTNIFFCISNKISLKMHKK